MADLVEQAVSVENAKGRGNLILVCEHATNVIPERFESLGLPLSELDSHSAWDPGAMLVARGLGSLFDAPIVSSGFSRLLYDCNRPPDSPTSIVSRTETQAVPGNQGLTLSARQERIDIAYLPFKQALQSAISDKLNNGCAPALVTVHSFTPVYQGQRRDVEIGLLHDEDSRLADAMLIAAHKNSAMNIQRNKPYSAQDGVTHTLKEHALPAQLLNVMIEVRNDLIRTDASIAQLTNLVGNLIEQGLRACQYDTAQIKGTN